MFDPYFGPPFIDTDVWRESPVRYRYVHGGFESTDTRFAFYFPEPRFYDGRFVQYLEGGVYGGHEGDALHGPEVIGPTIEWLAKKFGAYYVESNQGNAGMDPYGGMAPPPSDPTIIPWRASAESARYARELAREMYGWEPHHGYVMGASGGGIRTWSCLEHVHDVWDGGVPFVAADPEAGDRIDGPQPADVIGFLGPKLDGVVDALEPGGGDPFAGLNEVEADSLRALFENYGFPRRSMFLLARPCLYTAQVPLFIAPLADPAFVEDFWTVPGYAGADGELADRLVVEKLAITEVLPTRELTRLGITDHPGALTATRRESDDESVMSFNFESVGLRCSTAAPVATKFASLRIETGKAAGKQLTCWGTFGDVVVAGGWASAHARELVPGDEVVIDNRGFLAACHRHRYPDRRPAQLFGGPRVAGGLPFSGRFHGKMIMVNAALDCLAIPKAAVIYDRKVKAAYGDAVDDRWRLWWSDNSDHVGRVAPPGPRPVAQTRLVNYMGMVSQALCDLVDWVERGVDPPASTSYKFENGQLELPGSASERRGIQPLVTATANGAKRAAVGTGEEVVFEAAVETPAGGGVIQSIEWDFDGSGLFAHKQDVGSEQTDARLITSRRFDEPGTYFPAVRVVSGRPDTEEWPEAPEGTKVPLLPAGFENIDRVRVVVT